MLVLVCYDVATTSLEGERRLRTIANICEDHGVRVQYSIFECRVTPALWIMFRAALLAVFERGADSLRFYFLDENSAAKTEHHGVKQPLDPTGPPIV